MMATVDLNNILVRDIYGIDRLNPVIKNYVEQISRKIVQEEIEKFKKELEHNKNGGIIE